MTTQKKAIINSTITGSKAQKKGVTEYRLWGHEYIGTQKMIENGCEVERVKLGPPQTILITTDKSKYKAWARHLRTFGDVVLELDVLSTSHYAS